MDDSSKQPHTFGNGAQRNPHPRPFFYVQPPSQPYCVYPPWQLSNPYNHFGLPAGFNFGRPCMHPYPYVPYPGFVLPHAPIYPMDYRRMFEPRFQTPPWGDVPRQQHHAQSHGRRETACSGAQTDPSDAITKLLECLDKIRVTELQSADRELDSGVASQSSGMFSPVEEKKTKEQTLTLPSGPHNDGSESPAVTFGESAVAVYDSESSQVILDPLNPQGCWTGRLEEELPLDSSSVHEECPDPSASKEHFVSPEKEQVTDIQTNISVTCSSVPTYDAEERLKSMPSPAFPSSQPSHDDAKSNNKVSEAEDLEVSCEVKDHENYQILKLPFHNVLTPGTGHLSSAASPYYYNYLPMQTTQERMSVLSPSLDELSSRDEMFSTDLDDVDLFPNHVYASRRLSEVVTGSPQVIKNKDSWQSESKRFACACCGRSLAKGTSRNKIHSTKMYQEDAGDSEEEGHYGRACEQPVRVVVRKHSAPKKSQTISPRHAAIPWYNRSQYKELPEPVKHEDHDVCKVEAAETETEELDSSDLQCRTCQDRLCREDLTTSEQSRWTDGDVIPKRRQAAPLQRQVTSSQWKVTYHRPRKEDCDDDEAPPLHWERDMEAATSNLKHSYGLGPRGPNLKVGAEPPHGLHEAVPPLQGLPRPEEQHHKPFFYIQPPQPYLPMQSLQWPVPLAMPVSYGHYYGYPGLGYGLPMMPHYQPSPYMEPPGFVVPHTGLHLMDYRRVLNPQHYQTMAYHSRKFRYQQNSSTKEMTSSEVQTEPLVLAHKSSTPSPHDSNMAPGVPTGQLLSSALDCYPELQDQVTSSTETPSNSSFVIQTEEVRIECCSTPVGLQLLRAHETAEMSQSFSKDMVQCSSLLQSRVLQDERLHLPSDQSQQELQVCPDILLVGKLNTEDQILPDEEPRNQMDHVTEAFDLESQKVDCVKAEEAVSDEDLGVISKNFHLKGINLPFDSKYLDELRKMESTVWSAEDALIPSPELLVQNLVQPNNRLISSDMMEQEILERTEEVPSRESVHVLEMLSEDELENMDPTVENMRNHMVSEAETCPVINAPVSELMNPTEATLSPSLVVMEHPPLKLDDQQRLETNEDHEDTSFESLPASLPSTSWLSDFDIYYSNKIPQAPKKQSRPLSSCGSDVPKRRRKLDLDYKEQPSIRKPKERFKPKGKASQTSFSDHECCIGRNFNENFFSSYKSKTERLCSRCLSKRRICTSNCTSPSSVCDDRSLKRKAVPFQQWNDVLLPTCDACKSHTKRQLMRKGPNPDPCGPHHRHNTEGESSGNSSCRTSPKRRSAVDSMRPLVSKQNIKLPAVIHPKLREKNCSCDLQHQSVVWERLHHCSHGNANRGMDENCESGSLQNKWRNVDPTFLMHRWQTEKSRRDVMLNSHNGLKNEATSQHGINYRKTQPQSQGTRTKDTRC